MDVNVARLLLLCWWSRLDWWLSWRRFKAGISFIQCFLSARLASALWV